MKIFSSIYEIRDYALCEGCENAEICDDDLNCSNKHRLPGIQAESDGYDLVSDDDFHRLTQHTQPSGEITTVGKAVHIGSLEAFMARYADKLVDLDKICHLVKWYRRWADRTRADNRFEVLGVFGPYTVPKDPILSQQEWGLKLWDKAKFDSEFSEPDFTPFWGEGFMAVAAHADSMPALDRMVFEDCGQGSGRLQRAGMNVPGIPNSQKPELLTKRVGCTLDQASDFIDYWSIIDDSGELWDTFEKCAKWLSPSVALVSYERIAGELALVIDERDLGETGAGCEEVEFDEAELGETQEETPAWDLDQDEEELFHSMADQLADLPEISIDFGKFLTARKPRCEYTVVHRGGAVSLDRDVDQPASEAEAVFDRIGWTTPAGAFHYDRGFVAPAEFAYENLGDSEDDVVLTAAQVCPHLHEYMDLTASTKKARLAEVSKARSMAAKGEWFAWMNKPQRKEWWQAANKRQTECLRLREEYRSKIAASLTPQESKLLQQIEAVKSKAQARYFWANLYQAKDGKLPGIRPAVAEHFLMDRLDRAQQALK